MRVLINGKEWNGTGNIAAWLASREEVVYTIDVDGQEYSGTLEEALTEQGAAEVKITSIPVKQLLAETKETIKAYLPHLERGARQVAYLLQTGQEGEGFSTALQLIDGMSWLVQAVKAIQALEPEYFPKENMVAFKEKLEELLAAWSKGDYVLVGDLLEYELAPFLEKWQVHVG